MKRGFFISLIFALIAFYPALVNDGLPTGADMPLHYWKTFALDHLWSQGEVIPRWVDTFYYGYGAPTFQFTAAGPYALAVLSGKLPLVDDIWRIKLVWLLSLMLSSGGAYAFAARRRGVMVGLGVAASFVFAPAIISLEPIARASYPASNGIGFFVASLALLDRYAMSRRYGVWLIVCIAGLLLSHNVTAVMGAAVLVAWLVWQWLFYRDAMPYIPQALMLFLLACGVTAFFWIPVLIERHTVSIDRLLIDPNLDFHRHFETLGTLLRPERLYDAHLLNHPGKWSLGVVSWLLAVIGVVYGLFKRRLDHELLFWLLVALVSIYLVLPQSAFIWEHVSLLATFQFPTRFLNIAALAVAMLAAPVFFELSRRYAGGAVALLLLLLIAQGLRTTPARWTTDYPHKATAAAYLEHEIESGILGTTAANEFLPADVVAIPPPTGFVIESNLKQRINLAAYPDEVQIEIIDSDPTRYKFHVDAPAEQYIEVYQFYFPGWEITLDGEPFEMWSNGPYNFIGFTVPAGEHIVEIYYPYTGAQQAGIVISVLCLIFSVGWLRYVRPVRDDFPVIAPPVDYRAMVVVIIIAVVGSVVLMREGSAWVNTAASGSSSIAQHELRAQFDGGVIDLLGYDMERAGGQWRVDLYWRLPSLDVTINSFVHVVDDNGVIISQGDKFAMPQFAQQPDWQDGMTFRDEYVLPVPPEFSGDVCFRIGLWRCVDGEPDNCAAVERLPVVLDGESVVGDFIFLD